jgi:hypothetical protein
VKPILGLVVLAFGIMACASPVAAQKVCVRPIVETNDTIGNQFVFAFKEDLRKSATYVLLDSADGKSISVNLVTMSVADGASAISVLALLPLTSGGNLIVDHQILLVGRNHIGDMALNLLADLDKKIGELRAESAK